MTWDWILVWDWNIYISCIILQRKIILDCTLQQNVYNVQRERERERERLENPIIRLMQVSLFINIVAVAVVVVIVTEF